MNTTRAVALEVAVHWNSGPISQCDRRYFEKLSLWRDFFPADLGERLRDAPVGQSVSIAIGAGELVPGHDRNLEITARGPGLQAPLQGLDTDSVFAVWGRRSYAG